MLLFKDILTFLGLHYRDALLITIYQKSDESDNFNIQRFVVKKVKNHQALNGRTDFLVTIIDMLSFQSRTYLLKESSCKV